MPTGRHAAEPARRPQPVPGRRLPRDGVRSRHAADPVRRPLPHLPRLPHVPRPLVLGGTGVAAATVGGTVLALSLGVVGPFPGGSGESVQPVAAGTGASATDAGASATDLGAAADSLAAAFEARELAQVSRARTRSASPTPAPAATSAEPSPPAEPPPAPETPPVPAVVGQLWATTDVNVRAAATSDSERIGSLAAITQVDVTGATENGWTQVVLDGRAGWVNSSYLSESQPQPEPEAAGVSDAPCDINPEIEADLTANARAVYRAVCATFGDTVSAFAGYRSGGGDHSSGRAVDAMVTGEPGWEIARYVQANAAAFGVAYVIYEQRIWMAGDPASAWEWMEDRGSATANHYDHVHVSVS